MSRFVDIDTLREQGHSILDIETLHARLGLDQFGQAFETTVKPDAYQNFGFDQNGAALAQTEYVGGRQTHLSGVEQGGDENDPNSTRSRKDRASQIVNVTSLTTQQIAITTQALWDTVNNLTSQINGLENQQQQLVLEQAALQQEQAITAEMKATAEAGIQTGNAAYEAAEAAQAEAEEDLCSLPEGGVEGITLDALLDPDSALNQSFSENITELEAAEQASMAAQYQMYGAARMQAEAALREQREAAEAARLEEEFERIGGEIAELTEKLNLTQAQIGRLEDPEVVAAIERGDLTIEDAISNVSSNLAANGSSLTVEAAADADGQGVDVDPGVSLSASYNNAAGPRPDEISPDVAPELSQADLVMRQAQEAAARISFTPT